MPTLSNLLEESRFKPPSPDVIAECDRRAREAEREERRRAWVAKLQAAEIPPEFQRASLENCQPQISEWVERFKRGSVRNLILQGTPGTGKTYSASAALLSLLSGVSGKFTRESDIVRLTRDSMGGRERISTIVDRYSAPRVLILDDFGKIQHKDWSLPIVWEILDNRYAWRKPTIFTMQCNSQVLSMRLSTETDPGYTAAAIIDRMKDSDVVITAGESRRGNRD